MATLVGDRFARMAGGWLDIASATGVELRLGRAPDDRAERARRCATLLNTIPCDGPRLVDFGPVGLDGWFEAREAGTPPHDSAYAAPVFSLTKVPRAAVDELTRTATDPQLRGVRHVQLLAPSQSGGWTACLDAVRVLRDSGFVTVRADGPLPRDLRQRLCHRHLVVLVPTAAERSAGAAWAARLAETSDRGHLLIERLMSPAEVSTTASVVSLQPCEHDALIAAYVPGAAALDRSMVEAAAESSGGWPGRFALELARRHGTREPAPILRERPTSVCLATKAGTWPFSVSLASGAPAASPSTRLISRAERCHRHGRAEAGDRWFAAGLEASRRRGDAHEVVRQLEAWVPRLLTAGRWPRAVSVTSRALGDAVDPAVRASMARLAGAAHLEAGQLSRAGACVETAVAIEQLTCGGAMDDTVALRAAVRMWQGRCREGRAEIEALPADRLRAPRIAKWRELLAWAENDERRQRWMPTVDPEEANEPWTRAVQLFRLAASGSETQMAIALTAVSASRDPWLRVIAAQACLDVGDDAGAVREIARCRLRPMRARGLVDVVAASIRRGLSRAGDEELRWLEVVTSRERLRGLVRWGQGRSSMQMLHDVSQLLEIVQSSEDEATGLRQVCEWARGSAGASACAIVSAPTGDVVAGEALTALGVDRAQLLTWLDHPVPAVVEGRAEAHARAPVRYGGCVVGLVLGTAPPARARALFDAVQAAAVVSGAMLRARLDALAHAVRADTVARDILGSSPAIVAVRALVGRAAAAPFPVIIEGESGTGKELVARALHRLGPRRDRPFAALNCAALTDELVEAELFGHARGAFTHAVNARAGLFEEAHQGTLFLDEVGELSPRAQAKLLRVLQEGEIRRVGENDSRSVDVRVLAATNRPLAALAAAGAFREDLMFRLSVVRIQVPPLRERVSDVPPLALAFWRQAARRVGTRAVLGPDAIALLSQMSWPGNVRELQNALAAIAVAAPATGRVGARLVRQAVHQMNGGAAVAEAEIMPLDAARKDMERRLVAAALARHTGSRLAAAHALGLSRQGLSKAIRRLGLVEAGVA